MVTKIKETVEFDDTFAKLDIRVGRIVEVDLETRTHKQTYRMLINFGKYGKKSALAVLLSILLMK